MKNGHFDGGWISNIVIVDFKAERKSYVSCSVSFVISDVSQAQVAYIFRAVPQNSPVAISTL